MEMGTTHHQARWGGWASKDLWKMALSFVKCFFAQILGTGVLYKIEKSMPLGHVRLISFLGLVCAALLFFSTC